MDIEPIRADTEVVEMIDGLFKVAPEGWHYVRPSPAVDRAISQGYLEKHPSTSGHAHAMRLTAKGRDAVLALRAP